MAKVTVKADLDGTKTVIKNLNNLDKPLSAGTQGIIRTGMIENWLAGKGGDGKTMPGLSPKYAVKKQEGKAKSEGKNFGGSPIRNLLLSGSMQRAFSVGKVRDNVYKLFFSGAKENTKAVGNHKNSDEKMMKVSKKLKDRLTKFVNKAIFKGAK